MSVLNRIEEEVKFYEGEKLELNPSYAPTQPDLLEMIDSYLASKYTTSDYDASGEKKAFYNVLDNPAWVASKMIDIDVADIDFTTERSGEYWLTWLYEKMFRIWAKEKDFGRLINEMVYQWPRYGSVVAKRIRGEVQIIPVRNVISDPTASVMGAPIIEKHTYTLSDFEREAEKAGWDNYKEVIETKRKNKENFVDVYERTGRMEETEDNWTVVADMSDGKMNLKTLATAKFTNKTDRYKELAWEKVWGRWLGRGQCERLLENQIAKNETEYYFRKGLKWTSLRLFQTRDQGVADNVLTDLENGDILRVLSEIQPVATEERNLHAFNYADQKWNLNRSDRAFSHDILKGKRPAAGTPLGTSVLQTEQATGYFGFMKENLGMFLRDIIEDWIIPEFEKAVDDESDLIFSELSADETQILRGVLTDQRYRKTRSRFLSRNMRLPSPGESKVMKDVAEALVSKKKGMTIDKSNFENINYKVSVHITDEQVDRQSKIATAQMLIQMMGSNPRIFQDPQMRSQISKVLNWAGVNPNDMLDLGDNRRQNPMMAGMGGSISMPREPQTPRTTSVTRQV